MVRMKQNAPKFLCVQRHPINQSHTLCFFVQYIFYTTPGDAVTSARVTLPPIAPERQGWKAHHQHRADLAMLKIMSSQHFPHPNSQPVTAPCCCTRSRAQIISTLTPHLRGSAAERASVSAAHDFYAQAVTSATAMGSARSFSSQWQS